MLRRIIIVALFAMSVFASSTGAQDDLNALLEKMTKDSAKLAGASVVQIETRGGADMVVAGPKGQVIRKALGPTTGVVVDADGYIITSAFNFLNNPPIILVRVPGQAGEPLVATKVATDKSRMLTLLKVDAKKLPVATVVSKSEMREGQWSIALGRALDAKMDKSPAIAVGVISALNRVWGKAIQTDAKVSPINYGGPLIDIQGRIQGIIIPASPNGEDITAGTEWYDSGIGFAVPMEDVMAVLPRLKQGQDLQKGLLGVGMKSPDKFSVLPEIGLVQKGSSAEKAGLQPGDVLTEVDGKAVVNMAQVLHILGPKYEGDRVNLKYKRAGAVKELKNVELVGKDVVVAQPFLGILPMRDDPNLGVEIRHVYAGSPADKAGLKVGDRIVKFAVGEGPFTEFTGEKRGRTQFLDWLNTLSPGAEVKLSVKRKAGEKIDTVNATLDDLPGSRVGVPGTILDKLPEIASFKKALAPLELNNPNIKNPKIVEAKPPMPDTGLLELNTPDGEHKYLLWVYPEYDPNVAHSVICWLHPPGKNSKEELDGWADLWDEYCRKHHIILVMPVEKQDGWQPSAHADFIVTAVRETMKTYTCDNQRVVIHGIGRGGELALYMAFNHRDLFKGCLATGSSVTQMKDNVANQRMSFLLYGGEFDQIVKGIADSRMRLAEKRYPAFYRQMEKRGREYLREKEDIPEALRWLETLDMQ